jgi:isocitrate/isopropylmalate dehydrogenase
MKHFNIAARAGDGIGPEVMREAIKILRVIGKKSDFRLEITETPCLVRVSSPCC